MNYYDRITIIYNYCIHYSFLHVPLLREGPLVAVGPIAGALQQPPGLRPLRAAHVPQLLGGSGGQRTAAGRFGGHHGFHLWRGGDLWVMNGELMWLKKRLRKEAANYAVKIHTTWHFMAFYGFIYTTRVSKGDGLREIPSIFNEMLCSRERFHLQLCPYKLTTLVIDNQTRVQVICSVMILRYTVYVLISFDQYL